MKQNIATALLLSLTLTACGGSSSDNDVTDTDTDETICSVDCDSDTDTEDEDTDTDTDTDEVNLGAQILDTATDDVGELRISLSDISTGSLSATVQLQEDDSTSIADDVDATIKSTGYITLSNGSNEVAELILSSGSVKYRDVEDEQITIEGLTYSEGDELDVYIEWDDQEYYLSLDGGDTLHGPYVGSAFKDVGDSIANPVVDRLSFRIADTGSVSQHELNVDNIVVTDDGTEVLNESFPTSTYTVSDDLLTIYSSSGSEATVQEMDFADSSDDDNETSVTALDEFSFTSGSYDNSGSASDIVASLSVAGSATIANEAGALGESDNAISLSQDTDDEYYSYLQYSAASGSGMDQITGSFTTEVVMKLSESAIAYSSDVSLIDFADTTNYLGFKTYLESSDHSVKFKIYGGLDDEGAGLSSEARSADADLTLAYDTWYHIMSVYDADASTYGTITLYIDGTAVDSVDLTWAPAENDGSADKAIFLGGSTSSHKNLNGSVDNIATWNEAFDATAVLTRATTFSL